MMAPMMTMKILMMMECSHPFDVAMLVSMRMTWKLVRTLPMV